jgi:hypothetical protein
MFEYNLKGVFGIVIEDINFHYQFFMNILYNILYSSIDRILPDFGHLLFSKINRNV